eukprot:Rhum_TRINITY_DN634_c0_g1::Rhum_TRINITY_DN634_c0_g1_i1::g.2030::m.2030
MDTFASSPRLPLSPTTGCASSVARSEQLMSSIKNINAFLRSDLIGAHARAKAAAAPSDDSHWRDRLPDHLRSPDGQQGFLRHRWDELKRLQRDQNDTQERLLCSSSLLATTPPPAPVPGPIVPLPPLSLTMLPSPLASPQGPAAQQQHQQQQLPPPLPPQPLREGSPPFSLPSPLAAPAAPVSGIPTPPVPLPLSHPSTTAAAAAGLESIEHDVSREGRDREVDVVWSTPCQHRPRPPPPPAAAYSSLSPTAAAAASSPAAPAPPASLPRAAYSVSPLPGVDAALLSQLNSAALRHWAGNPPAGAAHSPTGGPLISPSRASSPAAPPLLGSFGSAVPQRSGFV